MEPAAAHPLGVGGGVAVVPGEQARPVGDHLTNGLVGVEQDARVIEAGAWALVAGLRVDDPHPVRQWAERGVGGPGRTGDGDAALAGTEPVHHGDAEAPGELATHVGGRLVAVDHAHRVVGVVGSLGGGQDVGQWCADVVGEGASVSPDVVEPVGGGEATPQCDRASGVQGDRPRHHHGVGVEQWHRAVHAVVRTDPEPLGEHAAGHGDLALRDPDGLGVAARARGEHQRDEVVGAGWHVRHLGERRAGMPAQQRGPLGGVDGDHGHAGVEPVQQCGVVGVREDERAVGEGRVADQSLAASRGVEPGHDELRARRRAEQVEVLGCAGQEEADVRA